MPRVIDQLVESHLQAFGAIEIAGTMWSGKTWTSEAHGNSEVRLVDSQARVLADGRWGAIEIKLGATKADVAIKNLMRLKKKVAANPAARNPEPAFMAVLTGKGDFRYQTPEGVYVFPITCLAP